jgi:hypothetical protein
MIDVKKEIIAKHENGVRVSINPLYINSYGKIVSVYERPSGTNKVHEPKFDYI